MIHVHGLAQFAGQRQERGRASRVERQTADGIDGAVVGPFPADLQLRAFRVLSFTQSRVQDTDVAESAEQLGIEHGHTVAPPPVHLRTFAQLLLKRCQALTELIQHGFAAVQWSSLFRQITADQSHVPSCTPRCSAANDSGCSLLHLPEQIAGQEQIDRNAWRELLAQRAPKCGGSEQREVEDIGIDGVVVIAFLSQQIEAGGELVLRLLRRHPPPLPCAPSTA